MGFPFAAERYHGRRTGKVKSKPAAE